MAAVERARDAFVRRDWGEAYAELVAVGVADLEPDDLERLAVAAYLVGEEETSEQAWERTHAAHEAADRAEDAARCALWLGMVLFLRGDVTRAGGWFARAERLAASAPTEGRGRCYSDHPLQRRLRDVHAITQHFLVKADVLTTAGAVLADHDPGVPLF